MARERRVKFEDGYYGGSVNPTAEVAIALADRRPRRLAPVAPTPAPPPPDSEWIPQLYERHGLATVAKISGLSLEKVKQILADQKVPLRGSGRPAKVVQGPKLPVYKAQ